MLKLSIVIPAYNVEKYIANCIDSCLRQDIPQNEYELVAQEIGDDSFLYGHRSFVAQLGNGGQQLLAQTKG